MGDVSIFWCSYDTNVSMAYLVQDCSISSVHTEVTAVLH